MDAPGGAVCAGVSFAFGSWWAPPLQCPLTSQVRLITSPAPDLPHRCQQGDGRANAAAVKSFTVKGPDRDSWARGVGSSNQPGLGCLAKTTLSRVLKGGQRDKERKGDPGRAWAEAMGLMLEPLLSSPGPQGSQDKARFPLGPPALTPTPTALGDLWVGALGWGQPGGQHEEAGNR